MKRLAAIFAIALGLFALSGCQGSSIDDLTPKATRALPAKIVQKMKAKGMAKNAPVYFRLFKDEHLVEVWKQKGNGKFDLVTSYNICAWSGTLGPKYKEGDRQAPEGYYPIRPAQMNPASRYFLSINTGYPNAYDRAFGRTGADLMIHGACSSSGCYSVTDESVQQIFAFARDAFAGGQQEIMLEALPFRMTPEKMALFSTHKDFKFWQMLREGYDSFELTKIPPKVDFCEKKYVFNRVADGGSFSVNAACPPSQPRWPQLTPVLATYDAKFQSSFAQASKRFEGVPFPIVHGGKSRPLDQKWKPQPVKAGPSTSSLFVEAERLAKLKEAKTEDEAAKGAVPVGGEGVAASAEGQADTAVVASAPASPDANGSEAVDAKPTATDTKAASVDAPKAGDAAAKAGDPEIVPLSEEQAKQGEIAKARDAAVPEPAVNPNAAAVVEEPAKPVKKKRRFWPFNGT
jgi:murein L,D-transpeptidase YafK